MTGFGPRADRQAQPDRDPAVDATATVGTWASQQAYRLGREHGAAAEHARVLDPKAGYDLGHDVGYSADTEHRAYVHQVMRGFEHGSQARQELAQRLLEQSKPAPRAATPQPQPELEAGDRGCWPEAAYSRDRAKAATGGVFISKVKERSW